LGTERLHDEHFKGGQLYRCQSLFGSQRLYIKSWIHPVLEYGCIGAASTHLNCLDQLQARVDKMCGFLFQSLTDCQNASILGFSCRLLAGEGHSG